MRDYRLFIRKITALFAVCALAVGLFAGCGKSDSGSVDGSGLKFMYSSNAWTGDTFKELLMNSVKEAGSSAGVTVDVQEECTSVDMQVEQMKAAAGGGYDAIICLPVDTGTALQLEAASGGIPIVFVNSLPSDDHLKQDQYMYVGSPERDAGELQAQYVWEKLGKPGSISAVIIEGEQGHPATIGRTQAVKDFFKDNNVQADIVFCDYATWSDALAIERFEVFLKEGKDFDAVFCNNDSMALGIVEAYKTHGFSYDDIPICGVDATAEGCQSIADGYMQFTAYQPAKGQAESGIATAVSLAKKGTAKGMKGLDEDGLKVWVPFEPVTSSNVKDYM